MPDPQFVKAVELAWFSRFGVDRFRKLKKSSESACAWCLRTYPQVNCLHEHGGSTTNLKHSWTIDWMRRSSWNLHNPQPITGVTRFMISYWLETWINLPCWELTYPHPRCLKMIVLFPRWDMLVSWWVIINSWTLAYLQKFHVLETFGDPQRHTRNRSCDGRSNVESFGGLVDWNSMSPSFQ